MNLENFIILQAKAALADDLANELRLYRGFLRQFNENYEYSRLFAPLEAYDSLFKYPDPSNKEINS